MTYKILNKIRGVSNYALFNNHLLYSSGNTLRDQKLYFDEKYIGVDDVGGYYFIDNKILFNTWGGANGSFLYNIVTEEIIQIMDCRVQNVLRDLVIYKKHGLFIYKNSNLEKLFISKYRFNNIYQSFGITLDKFKLLKISLTDDILWQFNLDILGNPPHENKIDEIEKIIGSVHGNIWFNTTGGRLVALNTETGEISKRYSYYPHDSLLGYDTNLKIGKDTFLSEWDNQIYGMSGNYFQRINTENLTIEEEFNYNSDPNGIGKFKNHYSFLLQGDYFTFLAQKDDDHSGIRYVGLFDYLKKELVWEYEVISIEERKNGNELVRSQPLYMSGDKLYIKDFKNSLHIFELDK